MSRSTFFNCIAGFTLLLILSAGCGPQKPWYHKSVMDWRETAAPAGEPYFSLFLIGDAGKSEGGRPEPAMRLLATQLKEVERSRSAVVWLGDNLYPDGLPALGDPGREEGELRLIVQIEAAGGAGKMVFVPGNHDWAEGHKNGYDQVQRGEFFVQQYAEQGNIWLPDNGCPGPVEVPLAEDIVMLVIDTQWWLHKHDKPGGESNCTAKTREEFIAQMKEAVERNRDKKIVVAAHHPLYSYGAHGGCYTPAAHLFPLLMVKENLYVPLPVLGTIGVMYRKVLGNIQDVPHPRYRELRDELNAAFAVHPDLIYAAGHDHCLQYLPMNGHHHIVSGSGSKTRWTGHGKRAEFTYAQKGFCRLDFYADGSTWAAFWVVADDDKDAELVYRRRLY